MIRTAYLRVYQPLSAFSDDERSRWLAQPEHHNQTLWGPSRKWLVTSALPSSEAGVEAEGAFVRRIGGDIYVCPYRTRLRMLAGLLAFRQSVPEEVADAFVPQGVAHSAARELAALSGREPDIRSHILHANWHVPLRWFAAFEGSERILIEDREGLRIRYETTLGRARERLSQALEILEASGIDDDIAVAVRELCDWTQGFSGEGLVELDYGLVAGMFEDEELVDDGSADEVRLCLDSLSEGDLVRAGRLFSTLSERWSAVRAHEVMN
ncbi:MAG: hypothetical protein M3391_03485 [Actinomycetota bacterium]|nr:hypothetical protein [Actinomycetota bacterium]